MGLLSVQSLSTRWFVGAMVAAMCVSAVYRVENDPEQLADRIAPYIGRETVFVAHIDLTRIDVDASFEFAMRILAPGERDDQVRRRRRPRGTGARSTMRLRTWRPAALCSPSPGRACAAGRSHADGVRRRQSGHGCCRCTRKAAP